MATSPSLTYTGLATTGGAATLTTSGEDINRTFTQQTTGSVYASFLVNVSSAQSSGDYFLHFGATSIGSVFGGRVWVKSTTGGMQFGISKATDAAGPVYSPTVYALNTTYFLVLKYTIVAGTANDIAGLFIEPVLNQPEPTVTATTSSTAGDVSNVGSIALRQGAAGSAANLRVDYIRVGTAWGDVTSSSTPVATLSTTPTSLTGYAATQGIASSSQTYTLTGSTLESSPVSVSATTGIELSTDNSSFGPTLSISPSSGSVSQVVYARIANTAATGAFSGTITNTYAGTLTASVSVSGQVNAPSAPILTAAPTTLTGFSTTQGTPSAEQSYTLTTANLTNDITVTAPSGVEVSTTSGSGFGASVLIPAATASPVVYARLTATSAGLVTGTITNVSGSLTATVSVNGTVNSNSPFTPISIARANIGQTYTIQGRVTVTNQLGARQIYIQDATGGIVVYSGPSGTDLTTQVQLGDSVLARGPISVFNGFTEITSPAATSFTIVSGAGTVMPTPIAITPDQLANYQGRLVSIANADISGSGPTFAGGASYTITAGGQSGVLRISANSPLAGAGRPSNPVSVTGISDRFASGATTPGTNGLQFQPRILADIPGSTAAQDAQCGGTESTTLSRDQTLDIAAWNMEFFGADGGTIICPNGNLNYNDMGPTNEDLQQSNAVTVLSKLNADIIATEEISDIDRFKAAVAAIPGSYSYVCSDKFSYYFQDECTQTPTGNPPTVFGPTKYAQKVCVIYNKATVTPVLAETKALLFESSPLYTYPSGNGWSSGRLPFMFVGDVTINGTTRRVHVVALHAKSGDAADDFNRRKQDFTDLKTLLDNQYPNANVVILGDYNDKATTSIYTSSPVSSFNNFVTDGTNYNVITKPLEQQNCSTFNSSASFIDHMIVSNDLSAGYIDNSTYVIQPFSIPNYGNTTSDHNPIGARFDLTKLFAPNTAPSVANAIAPQSATVGTGFTFVIPGNTFTDAETPASLTLGVSGLPAGLSFTAPATISGTPSTSVGSPFTVIVTATDPGSLSASTSFQLTVNPAGGGTPGSFTIASVTSINCVTLSAGERNVTFNPVYSGASGSPIAFSVVNERAETTDAGPYTLRLYTDNPVITLKAVQDGTQASFNYNWLAACGTTPPANTAPTVANAIAPQSATVGTGFTFVIPGNTFTDAETPASLTLGVSGLPAGLNFTAPATISGTPSTSVGSPFTVTVTATDPGSLSASTSFLLTVNPAGGGTPGSFTIASVTSINCVTLSAGERNVTFNPVYSGASGSPITFSVVNERAETTDAGPYTLRLYTDNPVITLKAVQDGTQASFSYNWLAACGTTPPANTAPTVANAIAPQSATVGTGFSLVIPGNTFTDAETPGSLTLGVSGLPAGLNFTAPATISGTPSTSVGSPFTVTVTATDPGSLSASTSFQLTVSPAGGGTPGFAITSVNTINCETISASEKNVTFTPVYSGVTGDPITFSVVNERIPTTNPGPYTLRLYTDNSTITLKAEQLGVVSTFSYNWLSACNSGTRIGVNESGEALSVQILGNPVANESVEVEIRGAAGQKLHLQTLDSRGRSVNVTTIEQASTIERTTLSLGRSTGVYFLQVTSPTQKQVVKLVKQ
ncbi:T9SS type A sorting domain-containing protein [Spirosoma aureum]|uniref:T9SS type A sorting domain-containing protein n=1 Tax=Spirosoma aureum TaxID=2692134 RepID=A0A6G9AV08_9BACT|nr:putative Ig domain-containing protein [Spirosoma aureum]QIP16184.1 T9SS type A sorting domain-containing protein [Spirosoma aureum]